MTDGEGAARSPVALINQSMARRLWRKNAVGRSFRMRDATVPELFTVIGIVSDFSHVQGQSGPDVEPAAYVPYAFEPASNAGLVVRVNGAPATVTAAIREQIRRADPGIAIFQIESMEERRQRSFWQYRAIGVMFAVFAAVALVLASIGVYGVLSYSVSQRTAEIGVRVALGAARGDVLRLIMGQGMTLAALGMGLGVAGALVATPVLRSLLYNITPSDPLTFVGVVAFLAAIAALASYIPARRAMAVDALAAIRSE
jgi:putative ABC transport system permease protein